MSDPNQLADEAFSNGHDSEDEHVSSADEQNVEQEQHVEQPEQAVRPDQADQAAEPEQQASESEEEATEGEPEKGKQHLVPVSELQKERQKRQDEAKLREIAEANAKQYQELVERISTQQTSQQPAQPEPEIELPDPYEDPAGYTQALMSAQAQQFQRQMINMQLNMSEQMARSTHGSDTVDKAYEAARTAGVAQRFIQSADAYGEMVRWHKEQQAIAEFGSDPAAYRDRIAAEIRQQVLDELKAGGTGAMQTTGQQAAPAQTAQPQRLPGTLSDAPAEGVQGRQLSQQALADDIYASDRDRRL